MLVSSEMKPVSYGRFASSSALEGFSNFHETMWRKSSFFSSENPALDLQDYQKNTPGQSACPACKIQFEACSIKSVSPGHEMLQSPSGNLPCFYYQLSDTCKHFISRITTLLCEYDKVGQKNFQRPVASIDFPECLLVLQVDISVKIQDLVVLSECKFLPRLANYCDLLDILRNRIATNKYAWGSETLQKKACMEVCAWAECRWMFPDGSADIPGLWLKHDFVSQRLLKLRLICNKAA